MRLGNAMQPSGTDLRTLVPDATMRFLTMALMPNRYGRGFT